MMNRMEGTATNGGMPITSSATVCVRRWGGRGSCRAVFPRIGVVAPPTILQTRAVCSIG